MRFAATLFLLVVVGCSNEPTKTRDAEPSPEQAALRTRCEAAIRRVTFELYPEGGQPKGGERTVIEQLNARATDVCVKEGLSDAQSACFEAIAPGSMNEGLSGARACLGDRSAWPSWFNGSGVQL